MLYDLIAKRKHKGFPFIKSIIFNAIPLHKTCCSSSVYHEFHVIEDGKLIILGAYHMKDSPEGLYLDCDAN